MIRTNRQEKMYQFFNVMKIKKSIVFFSFFFLSVNILFADPIQISLSPSSCSTCKIGTDLPITNDKCQYDIPSESDWRHLSNPLYIDVKACDQLKGETISIWKIIYTNSSGNAVSTASQTPSIGGTNSDGVYQWPLNSMLTEVENTLFDLAICSEAGNKSSCNIELEFDIENTKCGSDSQTVKHICTASTDCSGCSFSIGTDCVIYDSAASLSEKISVGKTGVCGQVCAINSKSGGSCASSDDCPESICGSHTQCLNGYCSLTCPDGKNNNTCTGDSICQTLCQDTIPGNSSYQCIDHVCKISCSSIQCESSDQCLASNTTCKKPSTVCDETNHCVPDCPDNSQGNKCTENNDCIKNPLCTALGELQRQYCVSGTCVAGCPISSDGISSEVKHQVNTNCSDSTQCGKMTSCGEYNYCFMNKCSKSGGTYMPPVSGGGNISVIVDKYGFKPYPDMDYESLIAKKDVLGRVCTDASNCGDKNMFQCLPPPNESGTKRCFFNCQTGEQNCFNIQSYYWKDFLLNKSESTETDYLSKTNDYQNEWVGFSAHRAKTYKKQLSFSLPLSPSQTYFFLGQNLPNSTGTCIDDHQCGSNDSSYCDNGWCKNKPCLLNPNTLCNNDSDCGSKCSCNTDTKKCDIKSCSLNKENLNSDLYYTGEELNCHFCLEGTESLSCPNRICSDNDQCTDNDGCNTCGTEGFCLSSFPRCAMNQYGWQEKIKGDLSVEVDFNYLGGINTQEVIKESASGQYAAIYNNQAPPLLKELKGTPNSQVILIQARLKEIKAIKKAWYQWYSFCSNPEKLSPDLVFFTESSWPDTEIEIKLKEYQTITGGNLQINCLTENPVPPVATIFLEQAKNLNLPGVFDAVQTDALNNSEVKILSSRHWSDLKYIFNHYLMRCNMAESALSNALACFETTVTGSSFTTFQWKGKVLHEGLSVLGQCKYCATGLFTKLCQAFREQETKSKPPFSQSQFFYLTTDYQNLRCQQWCDLDTNCSKGDYDPNRQDQNYCKFIGLKAHATKQQIIDSSTLPYYIQYSVPGYNKTFDLCVNPTALYDVPKSGTDNYGNVIDVTPITLPIVIDAKDTEFVTSKTCSDIAASSKCLTNFNCKKGYRLVTTDSTRSKGYCAKISSPPSSKKMIFKYLLNWGGVP